MKTKTVHEEVNEILEMSKQAYFASTTSGIRPAITPLCNAIDKLALLIDALNKESYPP